MRALLLTHPRGKEVLQFEFIMQGAMKTNREIAYENGPRFGTGIRDGNTRTARAHGTVRELSLSAVFGARSRPQIWGRVVACLDGPCMHHVVTSWSTHGLRNPAPCEDVNLFAVCMVRGRAGLMSTSNLAASGEASQARILAALFVCFSVSSCEHVFFLLLPLASASVVCVSYHSAVTLTSLSRSFVCQF